jgi:hypothetical protein
MSPQALAVAKHMLNHGIIGKRGLPESMQETFEKERVSIQYFLKKYRPNVMWAIPFEDREWVLALHSLIARQLVEDGAPVANEAAVVRRVYRIAAESMGIVVGPSWAEYPKKTATTPESPWLNRWVYVSAAAELFADFGCTPEQRVQHLEAKRRNNGRTHASPGTGSRKRSARGAWRR